jgi:hypothetical protein
LRFAEDESLKPGTGDALAAAKDAADKDASLVQGKKRERQQNGCGDLAGGQ